MDNQKQKKKKNVMDTLSATMVLVLIARSEEHTSELQSQR